MTDIPLASREGLRLDISEAFGKALRQRRKELGLTQEQLAHEADIQRNYVSLIERGINQPTITVIFKLATAMNCPPAQLVMMTEEYVKNNKKN
ncbi:helix-turn-helix domain-containing protein [Pseudomonas citronellolis]|uniref:helix-turn-helix domain-containing protein n=1 Tax=Pseudomonas citronellolis TaxID=53408 RepID=UPI00211227FE|nr:helix-turn-helix transcriptional regulator [Pseudomonas citronellolis]UUC48129.1 helix-turn-helix domain-containing protein [Pseudomonas citronellolis]